MMATSGHQKAPTTLCPDKQCKATNHMQMSKYVANKEAMQSMQNSKRDVNKKPSKAKNSHANFKSALLTKKKPKMLQATNALQEMKTLP